MNPPFKNLTLPQLKERLAKIGEPSYRAEQLFGWVYQKGVSSFDRMSDLPQKLRATLTNLFSLSEIHPFQKILSSDGTQKILFSLSDGKQVETVLIPAGRRRTVCLSTQVGCRFRCAFCASGLYGFQRHLSAAEIVDQLLYFRHKEQEAVSGVVLMGMGEPFDNYQNVMTALRIINEPAGIGLGARHITVSTAGIVPALKEFAAEDMQVRLALSLHLTEEAKRSRLMPINRKYSLHEVLAACQYYTQTTGRRLTIEYLLIAGVNDTVADAKRLAAISRSLQAAVNLIPFNPVPDLPYRPSSASTVAAFGAVLRRQKVNFTIRLSRGADIAAACGQLAGSVKKSGATLPSHRVGRATELDDWCSSPSR